MGAVRTQAAAEILVSGRVQGVGYRAFTELAASHLKLTGYVRNLDDGLVQIEVEGDREAIEALVKKLWAGPSGARVRNVQVAWRTPAGRFTDFSIRFF